MNIKKHIRCQIHAFVAMSLYEDAGIICSTLFTIKWDIFIGVVFYLKVHTDGERRL